MFGISNGQQEDRKVNIAIMASLLVLVSKSILPWQLHRFLINFSSSYIYLTSLYKAKHEFCASASYLISRGIDILQESSQNEFSGFKLRLDIMHIKPYSNRSKLSKSQLTWDQEKSFQCLRLDTCSIRFDDRTTDPHQLSNETTIRDEALSSE